MCAGIIISQCPFVNHMCTELKICIHVHSEFPTVMNSLFQHGIREAQSMSKLMKNEVEENSANSFSI